MKIDPVTSWVSKCHLILFFSVPPHFSRQHPGRDVWFASFSPTHGIRNVSTACLICCTLYTFTSHTPESHFPMFEALFVLLDPPRWWINSLPSLLWVKCPCSDDFPPLLYLCVCAYMCVRLPSPMCEHMFVYVCVCVLLCHFFFFCGFGNASYFVKYESFLKSLHKRAHCPFQPV